MQRCAYLRRDRALGLSNEQFDRVHTSTRDYDLTFDTTNVLGFDVTKEVITFIDKQSLLRC